MRIGLIGAGRIGGTLAALLAGAGHDVAVSNSRGPETLSEVVSGIGERARAVTSTEAAEFGEVLVVSVPFGRYREVPVDGTAGKVVIDTNNYYPQRDGQFEDLDSGSTTSSELLARHLDGARVVKAFNGIQWERLRDDGLPTGASGRRAIPISGDDPAAKQVVAELIDQIGFDPVDTGPLGAGGRRHQPGTAVYGANLPTEELRAKLG